MTRDERPAPTAAGRGVSLTSIGLFVVAAAAFGLLLWSRLRNLSTPLWNDEAYSVSNYMGRGPHEILFGKYIPNDHVLFELLGWATTKVFGRGEVQYRLASVVPGMVAVVVLAYWVRRWFGAGTAVVVLVLATLSLEHLTLVPQARGYGLAMLAATVLLIGAMHADRHPDVRSVVLCAVGGTVGVLTLPVFAVAYATHMMLLFARRRVRGVVVAAFGASVAVCVAVYAPQLGAIRASAGQDFGHRLGISGPIAGPYSDLYRPLVADLVPHSAAKSLIVRVAVVLAVVTFGTLGIRVLIKRGGLLWAHAMLPVLFTYAFVTVARYRVAPRFTSYLLISVVLVTGLGGVEAWRLARGVRLGRPVLAATAILMIVSGARGIVNQTRDQTRTPWENARFVADVARRTPSSPVLAQSGGSSALLYYVGSQLRLVGPAFMSSEKYCDMRQPFVLVVERAAAAQTADPACLRDRHAQHLQAPQQISSPIGHRDLYDIWVVPAA